MAKSTAEAEYVALSKAASQAVYLRELGRFLGVPGTGQPLLLRGGNQAALFVANNGAEVSRVKHIDVAYHFVRGSVRVTCMSTTENAADLFTKALTADRIEYLRRMIGLNG